MGMEGGVATSVRRLIWEALETPEFGNILWMVAKGWLKHIETLNNEMVATYQLVQDFFHPQ